MESPDVDGVDCGSAQLFLAARAGRELGAGIILSRAARDSGMGLSSHLLNHGHAAGLLSHPSSSKLAHTAGEAEASVIVTPPSRRLSGKRPAAVPKPRTARDRRQDAGATSKI